MSEAAELGFDPAILKAKYRAERDKRVRKDGNEQYVEISGQYAHYLDDPYVARVERAPMFDEVEVVVVGGGFGGLLAGARLKQAGIEDVRIIKKAATSAAPGTGTAIRARRATSRAMSTCRCSKRSATCRSRSTHARRRS